MKLPGGLATVGAAVRVERRPGLTIVRGKLLSAAGRGSAVHAGAFLRERRIVLDRALLPDTPEYRRILIHELFHFAWVRLGNPARWSFEKLLAAELRAATPGELGWSAEWRKNALRASDRRARSLRWREYCCESFCDTAAWRWSGLRRHPEFTLPAAARLHRKRWFHHHLDERAIPI